MSFPMLLLSPVLDFNEYIYISLTKPLRQPYFPPEHTDKDFVKINGIRILDCPIDNLVENLLDMIHISFVHTFGNKELPLPTNIRYYDLDEYSGRTVFEYKPNQMTISRQMGDQDQENVRVENEFYLPSTTLTRVSTGGIIKTVFTQCLPITENRTILFWAVYRNFWKDPFIPQFTMLGDEVLRFLMEKTIDEDQSILSRAYPHARKGFLTKYDITIRMYRKKRNLFIPDVHMQRDV
jgi:phenylpropionate dioxygenase-like ring-hydroxylating dioxygenase large terminal subunit